MDPGNVFNPVYVAILLHRDDQTLLNYLNIWIDQIELDGTLAKNSYQVAWRHQIGREKSWHGYHFSIART